MKDLFNKTIGLIDECNKSIINEENIIDKVYDKLENYEDAFKHTERSIYLFRKPKNKVSKKITVYNVIAWLKYVSFYYQEKIFSPRFLKNTNKKYIPKKILRLLRL